MNVRIMWFSLSWTLGLLLPYFGSPCVAYSMTLTFGAEIELQSISSKRKDVIVKPWELSPTLTNDVETLSIPGWVDPVPLDLEDIRSNSKMTFYDRLKKPIPTVAGVDVKPSKTPKLPWLDLDKIPKTPRPSEEPKPKVRMPYISGSFQVDGKIAVFKTTEDHLYYVVPNRWLVTLNGYVIDKDSNDKNTNTRRLRFLLSPSYIWADQLIKSIKEVDKDALFVPIPKKIVNFQLDVPELLGEVQHQILPTDGMTIGDQIYMSVKLDDEAVEIFRILGESKTFLTGSVRYTYPYDEQSNVELVSDIWLNL